MTAHVLFDSGATQSFVSVTLSKKFGDSSGVLDYPLEVEIAIDDTMSDLRAHRSCILELFYEKYLIYLVPIPFRGMKLIVGINWMSQNGDKIIVSVSW